MIVEQPTVRPLLIAEAANPEWVSVPLEGWSLSRAIATLTGAHVVTQIRNRDAFLRAGLRENEDFTAIDTEKLARRLWKLSGFLRGGAGKGWTTVSALSAITYYHFEKLIWEQFRDRITDKTFNIVHRITPLSPTIPSLLATRCKALGVPFVIGPLNGGVPWPRGFRKVRWQEREWLSYVRYAHKLLPGYCSTRRNCAAIIAGSKDTLRQIEKRYMHKCHYIPENGIDPSRFILSRKRQATIPLRLIFVGRLVPYKGVDMLLEAAAPMIRDGAIELKVVGDGPARVGLHSICTELELTDGVKFVGWVPHTELQQYLVECDVFAFPSIREFGGAVVLEAMATGLVPIVVDYGGPGELTDSRSGFTIPLSTRSGIIASLRRVLEQLVRDPRQVDTRSIAARERALSGFSWNVKACKVVDIYKSLIH